MTGVFGLIAMDQASWACSAEHVLFLKIHRRKRRVSSTTRLPWRSDSHLFDIFIVKSCPSLADNIKRQALRTPRPVIEYRAWESYFHQ